MFFVRWKSCWENPDFSWHLLYFPDFPENYWISRRFPVSRLHASPAIKTNAKNLCRFGISKLSGNYFSRGTTEYVLQRIMVLSVPVPLNSETADFIAAFANERFSWTLRYCGYPAFSAPFLNSMFWKPQRLLTITRSAGKSDWGNTASLGIALLSDSVSQNWKIREIQGATTRINTICVTWQKRCYNF